MQEPQARRGVLHTARSVFKAKGCKIVALDVLDAANIKPTIGYIRKFMKYAKKGKPRIWGLHNYSDTNRFQDKRTKAVLKLVPGEVWLTETGGVVNFGGSFPYSEDRAAKALTYMFKLAAAQQAHQAPVHLPVERRPAGDPLRTPASSSATAASVPSYTVSARPARAELQLPGRP